jgi:hypothetical protein
MSFQSSWLGIKSPHVFKDSRIRPGNGPVHGRIIESLPVMVIEIGYHCYEGGIHRHK